MGLGCHQLGDPAPGPVGETLVTTFLRPWRFHPEERSQSHMAGGGGTLNGSRWEALPTALGPLLWALLTLVLHIESPTLKFGGGERLYPVSWAMDQIQDPCCLQLIEWGWLQWPPSIMAVSGTSCVTAQNLHMNCSRAQLPFPAPPFQIFPLKSWEMLTSVPAGSSPPFLQSCVASPHPLSVCEGLRPWNGDAEGW